MAKLVNQYKNTLKESGFKAGWPWLIGLFHPFEKVGNRKMLYQ